jgi:ABC-type oligopeptide transport system substrate-binding subunit/class 3 adenylate cyclase
MKCAHCGFNNDADAEFCENCGAGLARACSQCGSRLKPDAKFCKKCGALVSQSPSPVSLQTDETERRHRLAALQQAAPQALRDKIRASSAHIEGERKPVTIVFTDIAGSTSLAEKLDPEEWKEIVSGAHQRVSEAVYRYEGTIAQLLGDGVLAFFGAPITHEDDPLRAVRAGLDLQRAIDDYAGQLRGYVDNFQLRVGINTGTVVVGQVGSDLHMEYLAIGDAVNLAARLQSAAQPGKVLISESTERLVKAAFDLQALGEITVKGKAAPIKVFEVVERKAAPASGRGVEGLSSPLVGRERELAALEAALAELTAGRGQIVSLLGEAGIGKTRLVDEGRRAQPQLKWLEGRALSYGQALPFWTIMQLIKNDLGLSDADPEARIKVALRRRVSALFGEQVGEALPYLSLVLGIELEPEAAQRLRALDDATLKRQIHQSIGEYFARLAAEQPTVLVFEDLHWADPSTLQVLESLLALTDRVPLLLLLLARAERDQGWWTIKLRADTDYAHRYAEIPLKPLTPSQQNQLVDNLLDVAELPDATRRLMLDRSEGNPFYLEEVIRSLIEQGAIAFQDRRWQATDKIAGVQIPDTLQGVLLARIDRLSEDVRHTLQVAAVIGKSFRYRLLEAVAEAGRQLDGHLSELQRVDLVQEKARRPDLEYIFKHSLTQAAAYDSLLIERRKEFHRRVGLALESLYADRQEESYGLLAHHFGRAGEQAKAIEYATKAGDRARELFAYREAIDYYQQALAVLKEQEEYERAARTLMKIGLLFHTIFDFQRSRQAYEEGFALWRRADEIAPNPILPPAPHAFRVPWGNPTTLDPGLAWDTGSSAIIDQLFSGLVELTPDLDVVPGVARTWDVLDGGQKYVFHLHDEARWSDGTALTAHDFEFAWKRVLDPQFGSPPAHLLYVIEGARAYHQGQVPTAQDLGVRALDDLTLAVELESPTGYFLHLLTFCVTYPVPRQAVEKHGLAWTEVPNIVTNGAFLLDDWQPKQSLILSRNPSYRGRFGGNVQRIEVSVLNDDEAALELYDLDRLDATDVPFAKMDEVRRRHAAEYMTASQAATDWIGFDVTRPPFDDARVRRAFAQAIDRDALANRILSGMGFPATGGLVPPGIPGHSAAIGLAFDPDRARQMLAEAGYPNGLDFPKVDLFMGSDPGWIRCVEYLKAQWQANLGVDINQRIGDKLLNTREILELLRKGQLAMFAAGWLADYPDADSFLRAYFASVILWRNATFDQLVKAASHVSEQVERIKLYQAADRILIEEAAVIPLWYGRYHLLVKPWISRFRLSPMRVWHWKDVVIEPH